MNKEVLIEQIKSEIAKFRKSVQSNIDTLGASYYMSFKVRREFSLDVVDALKKEGLDVSIKGDDFGMVDIEILINEYKKERWMMKNGSSIGFHKKGDPNELRGSSPFVLHPLQADEIPGYTWLKEAMEKGAIIYKDPSSK